MGCLEEAGIIASHIERLYQPQRLPQFNKDEITTEATARTTRDRKGDLASSGQLGHCRAKDTNNSKLIGVLGGEPHCECTNTAADADFYDALSIVDSDFAPPPSMSESHDNLSMQARPVGSTGTAVNSPARVDLTKAGRSPHGLANVLGRAAWAVVYRLLFRTSPRPFKRWRNFLLTLFGAQLHKTAVIYPTAKIWWPGNLVMGPHSCLADDVDCYCVAEIRIGEHSVVSQYTYLCGASHDYMHANLPLTPAPIVIEDQVWIAADVFVGPGVKIGQGTVVGARSTVVGDLPPWKVCVGSPAKPIKDRVLKNTAQPNSGRSD